MTMQVHPHVRAQAHRRFAALPLAVLMCGTLAGCNMGRPVPVAAPLPRNVAPPVSKCVSTSETLFLAVRCSEDPPPGAPVSK